MIRRKMGMTYCHVAKMGRGRAFKPCWPSIRFIMSEKYTRDETNGLMVENKWRNVNDKDDREDRFPASAIEDEQHNSAGYSGRNRGR